MRRQTPLLSSGVGGSMEVGQRVTVTGEMRRDVTAAHGVRWLRVDLRAPVECIYLGTKSRAVGYIDFSGEAGEVNELVRTGYVRLHYVQPLVASNQYRLPMHCEEYQIAASAG